MFDFLLEFQINAVHLNFQNVSKNPEIINHAFHKK